jgi:GDYXXLXY protein
LKSNGPTDWTLAAVSEAEPDVSGDGQVVLKAIVDYVRRSPQPGVSTVGRLRYGIERFYVSEGTGRELEAQVREKLIVAVLAVGSNGKVALKGLEADGKRIAEEPLL